jgi:DNA polymerase-3 subunit beta
MKIILLREYLKNSLNLLSRIAKANNNLPILSSVLIKAKKDQLLIKATNLEIGVIVSTRASIKKDGEVAVPLRMLQSVVENIHDEKIELEKKENNLKIKTKKTDTEINGFETADFPIIPKLKEKGLFKIKGSLLAQAIEQVIPSMAISNIRPDLASIYLNYSSSKLKVVATDGFRLGEKIVKDFQKEDQTEDFSIIIPGQSAQEIVHVLKNYEPKITIFVEENQIGFRGEGLYFMSRLIDGNYPDYTQIIPKEYNLEIEVKKNELLEAVKLVSIFSNVDNNEISLQINQEKKELELSSKTSNTGKANRVLKIRVEKAFKSSVLINHRFLLDGINSFLGDKFLILQENSNSPLVLKPNTKEKDFLYLISPIKK